MKRLPLLLALAALAAVAAPGEAAAPFTYTDPAGDARGGSSGLDIVSVTYATTGRGAGRGYVPEALVVTVKASGAIVNAPGVSYRIESEVVRCGYTAFAYSAATYATGRIYTTCGLPAGTEPGTARVFQIPVDVSGDTITFTAPLDQLAGAFGRGDVLRQFRAYTGVDDPVFAAYGTNLLWLAGVDAAADRASSFSRWTIG